MKRYQRSTRIWLQARFGLVCALLVGAPSFARAQQDILPLLRLSVRPRELKISRRTEQAGVIALTYGNVYVPPQCVGTRRCPVIIDPYSLLGPVDRFSLDPKRRNGTSDGHDFAVKFGMLYVSIYAFPTLAALEEAQTDSTARVRISEFSAKLSQTITEIFQKLAADPDRVAIAGASALGTPVTLYGGENLDVFSRLAFFTEHGQEGDVPPIKIPGQTNEYYISTGIGDGAENFLIAKRLRDRGYPTELSIEFRDHGTTPESADFFGHWLLKSWGMPDGAARPEETFGDPPELTEEIANEMTAFWSRFMQEPDSIKITARRALIREVVLPFGTEKFSTEMVNMAALAAKYPSVAAALKAAGLTPQQHDRYRAALLSAQEAWILCARDSIGSFIFGQRNTSRCPEFLSPSAAPMLTKNLKFFMATWRGGGDGNGKDSIRTDVLYSRLGNMWLMP